MRNKASPEDINKVLETLRALWLVCPHQRLGQLLINLAMRSGAREDNLEQYLWNMDEDDILQAVKAWMSSWSLETHV